MKYAATILSIIVCLNLSAQSTNISTLFHNNYRKAELYYDRMFYADRNRFPIAAIYDSSGLEQDMPDWDVLVLRWSELGSLPASWAARLAEWRGIYLIVDESDGRGYVGSAYGSDNILGRWTSYARTGHGGNRELRGRDPKNFRFSILQRVSPDMDPEDVIRIESSWKDRLHTRELGLNKN